MLCYCLSLSFSHVSHRETGLNQSKLKEAHRRIMLLNHPDRGGSPFLASKINEAKDLLDKK
jgi:DnaJ family protein C protein 19